MRVLVCGGRDFDNYKFFANKMTNWLWRTPEFTPLTIISGGARGVDTMAIQFAIAVGVPYEEYKADWDKHGKAAGPIRNQQMLDEGKPDLVIAFPGGKGTADMISRAKKAGIPVEEIKYDVV